MNTLREFFTDLYYMGLLLLGATVATLIEWHESIKRSITR